MENNLYSNIYPTVLNKVNMEIIDRKKLYKLIDEYLTVVGVKDGAYLMKCSWCNKIYTIRVSCHKQYESNGFCDYMCNLAHNKKFHPEYKIEGKVWKKTIERLRKEQEKCIVCGYKKFIVIHHKDSNHENNHESNLIPLCPNHHNLVHYKNLDIEPFIETWLQRTNKITGMIK